MLALHLLQNGMIYVNTLMLQQILAQPHWRQELEPRDQSALTPLIWEHVNPYGRFELDLVPGESEVPVLVALPGPGTFDVVGCRADDRR